MNNDLNSNGGGGAPAGAVHDDNPDQKRDDGGRWVKEGGGSSGSGAGGSSGQNLGNPESNTGRSRNSAPIAELKGDELGVRDGESIQDAAHRYYDELRKSPAKRDGFGIVEFTRVGRNKLDSASRPDPKRLKLLPAVRLIIERGDYIGCAELSKERKDGLVAFHYFEGNVMVGGEKKFAGVSVGEDAFKHKFYNLTEDPDALLAAKKRKAQGSSEEKILSPAPSRTSQAKPLTQV